MEQDTLGVLKNAQFLWDNIKKIQQLRKIGDFETEK